MKLDSALDMLWCRDWLSKELQLDKYFQTVIMTYIEFKSKHIQNCSNSDLEFSLIANYWIFLVILFLLDKFSLMCHNIITKNQFTTKILVFIGGTVTVRAILSTVVTDGERGNKPVLTNKYYRQIFTHFSWKVFIWWVLYQNHQPHHISCNECVLY